MDQPPFGLPCVHLAARRCCSMVWIVRVFRFTAWFNLFRITVCAASFRAFRWLGLSPFRSRFACLTLTHHLPCCPPLPYLCPTILSPLSTPTFPTPAFTASPYLHTPLHFLFSHSHLHLLPRFACFGLHSHKQQTFLRLRSTLDHHAFARGFAAPFIFANAIISAGRSFSFCAAVNALCFAPPRHRGGGNGRAKYEKRDLSRRAHQAASAWRGIIINKQVNRSTNMLLRACGFSDNTFSKRVRVALARRAARIRSRIFRMV